MARRRLLNAEAWNRLLMPPVEERDMVRHFTLSRDDLALISSRRTEATQLGFAMLLLYLRCPGRVLAAGETPPAPIIAFVARQLGVRRSSFTAYGRRDETRRKHLADLTKTFGFHAFGDATFGELVAWLTPAAQIDRRPGRLISLALDELRQRQILLPPPIVIERAIHQARSDAERISHRAVIDTLTVAQRQALDALLQRRAESHITSLAWLRTAPQSPAGRNLLAILDRIRFVREIGLKKDRDPVVPPVVFERMADEGLRMTTQHLAELVPAWRHAVLAATVTRLESRLIDAALFMFEKLIGSFGRKAERNAEEKTLQSAGDLRAHLKTLAGACNAMITARGSGQDPIAAIEQHLPWARFVKCVTEARALTAADAVDSRSELLGKYATIRKFAPALLETVSLQGAESAASLLKAIGLIREAWRTGKRVLPATVPTGFVRRSWRAFVIQQGAIDRRAYEICAIWELRERLRAGDIWVEGSRQYQALEATLIPQPTFEALKAAGSLPLAIDPVFTSYIAGRGEALKQALDVVTSSAKAGTLPDAAITDGELKISPLRANMPDKAEAARDAAYSLVPHVKITDLLLEVDAWTGFSACFTHQRNGRSADDRNVLLASVLADGINLGLTRMAETCRGVTLRQLAWVHDWHVREETYTAALTRLIEAHRALPIARLWGDGTTSSSDGQYFRAGSQGAGIGDINARHGNEPGVVFYTHISDQFGPFHTKVIAATASEAPHVLDGLLYHQTGLQISEHYTDTGGATDHVFGVCPFFGLRFAPRLRDIKDRRLYLLPGMTVDPVLEPMVGGTLDIPHVESNWNDLLRLGTSIHAGITTASAMLRRLAAFPRQNGLALALREVGRLERTLFTLDWIRNLDLRRRAHAGLNKGEARNALARAIFFNRLGELRDRQFENQVFRASGLNLLVAAIILWNSRYLAAAFETLDQRGKFLAPEIKKHTVPLGWEHISLTGDYVWNDQRQPTPGELRPLRRPPSLLVA
jgi:TnpA family transposase